MFKKYLTIILSVFMMTSCASSYEKKGCCSKGCCKTKNTNFQKNTFKIDHMFTLVDEKDIPDEKFKEHGFFITTHYRPHKGQGTAGRFVFFQNMYLEFLYVYNKEDAQANTVNAGIDVYERSQWKENDAFPYGIGYTLWDQSVRHDADFLKNYHVYSDVEWLKGRPPILIDHKTKQSTQPMNFILADREHYEDDTESKKRYLTYGPVEKSLNKKVTSLQINFPSDKDNYERIFDYQAAVNDEIALIIKENTDEWLLTITCDNFKEGQTLDLRPEIPVVIRY